MNERSEVSRLERLVMRNLTNGGFMGVLIGQTKTRFWQGEKYVFERVGKGEWKCIYQDSKIIPSAIIAEVASWE